MRFAIWVTFFSLTLYSKLESVHAITLSNLLPPLIEPTEEAALAKWKLMEQEMLDGIRGITKQLMDKLRNSEIDVDISPECTADLMKVIFDVQKLKLWALKMLDATAKPPAGLLSGTLSALGNFDECLNVVFPSSESDEEPTVGQYCLLDFGVPLPPKPDVLYFFESPFKNGINSTLHTEIMQMLDKYAFALYFSGFRVAVCIPSTCTEVDLMNILAAAAVNTSMNGRLVSCETKQPFKIDTVQLTIAGVILGIVAVVVICSITDHFLPMSAEEQTITRQLIHGFSFIPNFTDIFKVKDSTGSLDSLNGLRAISMTWVILGHSYLFINVFLTRNSMLIEEASKSVEFQPIINGYLSVQTFLAVTAVLVAHTLVKAYDQNGQKVFNIPLLLIRRIWRFLPSEMLTIGIHILFPLFGSGPMYQDTNTYIADTCRNYWWYNILFINNFFDMMDMCLSHSWYIALDIQLFLIAMVYFVILFKNRSAGAYFSIFLTLASIVSVGVVIYIFRLPPTNLISIADVEYGYKNIRYVFETAYASLGGYAISLALGTFIARNEKLKLSKLTVCVCWVSAILVGIAIVYGVQPYNSGRRPSPFEAVLYGSLHRSLWALSISWVIIACTYNYSGYIGLFLSWKGFQPIVKVSYLMYLLHFSLIFFYMGTLKGHMDMSHIAVGWLFMGNLGYTVLASIGIRALFEAPMIQLDRIFIGWLMGGKKPRPVKQKEDKNTDMDAYKDVGLENGSADKEK